MKRDHHSDLSEIALEASVAFRKLDAEAQLRELRGQKVERTFTVERDTFDQEARTAWLSIASEEPYERWFGIEILDMNKASIRDQRLKMGAPLLVGHDTSDQVGVVERYEITPDKKLRILARFGKSARAEEIWQDVLDGIRRNTSVGYVIHDLVMESKSEDLATYRVTDWEPLEGSIVPVPADPTVGVGRNFTPHSGDTSIMDEKEKQRIEAETRAKVEAEYKAKAEADARAAAEAARAAANTPEAILKRETDRVNGILAAGDEYRDVGGPELARDLIKDSGATLDTFKARMLEKMRGKQTPTTTAAPGQQREAFYGDALRTRFRYGALKAFRDITLDNGQKMSAEEAAHRAGMWMAAVIYKKPWAHQWCRDKGMELFGRDQNGQVRVMAESSMSVGAALVPVEMEQAVIDLRDVYGVARRLLRVRPMGSDQLQIPRRTGGLTAYFFTDDDGTGLTASDKGWDQVLLSAKKLGVLARVSKDLVEDAIINVVDDLAMEMAYAFAVKEDQCMIDGSGASTYGGMQGFRPRFVGTAYSSRIALASGHNLFTEVDNTDLTNVMAGPAAYGVPGAKWLCSNTFKSVVFDRLKAVAGGNDTISLGQQTVPAYLGYEIVTSEAMPAGAATDYQNLVMAMFGRFDLAGSLGNRRGIEVQILQERYAELGQLGVIGTERFDINIHDLGSTTVKGPVAAAYGA